MRIFGNRRGLKLGLALAGALGAGSLALWAAEPEGKPIQVHDRSRPQPAAVDPGTSSTPDQPGKAPSDAVVLFDGKDLSAWKSDKDAPAKWKVENGYFEVVPKAGTLTTKEQFGDCQLHIEFQMPNPPRGKDQDRGNSGIFLMGRYELQVLDCYQSETYADGTTGAMYGQYPPLVNVCRPPGEWQSYDVIWHGPRYKEDGSVDKPARATVLLNGVLVQDNVPLMGGTAHRALAKYSKHGDKGPISLQDHAHPVRYRNVWVRPIPTEPPATPTIPTQDH